MPDESAPTRQKVVGGATRAASARSVVAAARIEFLDHGYAGATVARVAERAGVTVQTVYAAVGSKRTLLQSVLKEALSPSSDAPYPEVLLDRLEGMAPRAVVDEIASITREIGERAAVFWGVYRDAAATDAAIAEDWNTLQQLRRGTVGRLLDSIPPGGLREGLSRNDAIDTVWVLTSPETWQQLCSRAGRTPAQFETWLASTIAASILATGPRAAAGRPGR